MRSSILSVYIKPTRVFYTAAQAVSRLPNARLHSTVQNLLDKTNTKQRNDNLAYHVAASFCAKQKDYKPTQVLRLNDVPSLLLSSGEDAFFVTNMKNENELALGVADGVGGYSELGISSTYFATQLCQRIRDISRVSSAKHTESRSVLRDAFHWILTQSDVRGGGSTICVGIVGPDGALNVANLGDSGFTVMRHGKVHFNSQPQTHAFNTPYQLGVLPQKTKRQLSLYGGAPLADDPEMADVSSLQLQNGDVVIFATDGVWDNLSSQDVLRAISEEMIENGGWAIDQNGIKPAANLQDRASHLTKNMAVTLASIAKDASRDSSRDGPFAKAWQRHFPNDYFSGGKVDDMCILCMVVVHA